MVCLMLPIPLFFLCALITWSPLYEVCVRAWHWQSPRIHKRIQHLISDECISEPGESGKSSLPHFLKCWTVERFPSPNASKGTWKAARPFQFSWGGGQALNPATLILPVQRWHVMSGDPATRAESRQPTILPAFCGQPRFVGHCQSHVLTIWKHDHETLSLEDTCMCASILSNVFWVPIMLYGGAWKDILQIAELYWLQHVLVRLHFFPPLWNSCTRDHIKSSITDT